MIVLSIILDGSLDAQFHAAYRASFRAPSGFQQHLAEWTHLLPFIADDDTREQLRSDVTHGLDTYWEGDAAHLPQVARHFFRTRQEEDAITRDLIKELRCGRITASATPPLGLCSFLVVPKSNGKLRVCRNYKVAPCGSRSLNMDIPRH